MLVRTAKKAVSLLAATSLVAIGGVSLAPSASASTSCSVAGVDVVSLHTPDGTPRPFYSDTSVGSSNHSGFAGWAVDATGAGIDNLWIKLTNFTGDELGLNANQPASFPALGTGHNALSGYATAYAYLQANNESTNAQPFDVEIWDGVPGAGGTQVCVQADQFSLVKKSIDAAANKVTGISVSTSTPALGSTFDIIATGDSGTRGAGVATDQGTGGEGVFAMAPATADNWPAAAFMVTGLDLSLSTGATSQDYLRSYPAGSSAISYTATYHMSARGTTAGNTNVAPVQNIASGTQVKYTGSYTSAQLIAPPADTTNIEKTVTNVTGSGPWTVSYQAVVSNSSPSAVSIDYMLDDPGPNTDWSFVPGSMTVDGVAFTPLVGADTVTIHRPVSVPGNGSVTIAYQLQLADVVTNTIVGMINITPVGGHGQNSLTVNPGPVVTFDANGGSGAPASQGGLFGEDMTLSATIPTWAGHTFTGWNTAANGSGTTYSAGGTIAPTDDVTLYAQWVLTTYTLDYNDNGGTGGPSDVTGQTPGTNVTVSATEPTRAGYVFTGWNTAANGSGSPVSSGDTVTLNSDVTIYAQWTANNYTVAYNGNGGSGAPADDHGDTDTVVTLSSTTPTRSHYTFTGWNTAANGSGTSYASGAAFTVPAGNTTLYAQWAGETHTVHYDANGGSGAPADASLTYPTAGTVSATEPTRTGYTFTGWNTASDGSGVNVSGGDTLTSDQDWTLYAMWEVDTYAVAYNANGGSGAPATQNGDYGTDITLDTGLPTRTGYTFDSWNTASNGSGTSYSPGDTFTIAGPTTLYAQWIADDYGVTYDANLGTGAPGAQGPVHVSDVVTLSSTEPTRTGYTFAGWNTASGGSGTDYVPGGSLVMPAGDVILYAQWTAIDYLLVYSANGGTGEPASSTVHYGDVVTLSSTEPTRTGYTFTGWNTAADGSGDDYASGDAFLVDGGALLYAQWLVVPPPSAPPADPGTPSQPETPVTPEDPSTPPAPVPPAPADPEDTNVVTKPGRPVTSSPLEDQAPPTGEVWVWQTMKIVDPATGALTDTVATPEGTWVLDPATGAVTFTPAKGFVGTAVVEFRITSSGGTTFSANINATVTKARTWTLTTTVYFDSGSPVLTDAAKAKLDRLVAKVEKHSYRVMFGKSTGFVQATSYAGNDMSLSTARARAVRTYLLHQDVKPIGTFEGLGKAHEPGWKARRATVTITVEKR